MIHTNPIWQDIITTFIGALLALIIALFLERKSNKKQRKDDQFKKEQLFKQSLKLLTIYIERVEDNTNRQLELYRTFIKWVNGEPHKGHYFPIDATYDLERLKNLSSSSLYEAFMYYYPLDKSNIKDYCSIFSSVDILYKSSIIVEDRIQFYQDSIIEIQKQISELICLLHWQIQSKCIVIVNEKPNSYHEESEYLLLKKYIDQYEDILTRDSKDLNSLLFEYVDSICKNIEAFKNDPSLLKTLFVNASTAIQCYKDLVSRSNEIVDFLKISISSIELSGALSMIGKVKAELEKNIKML